MPKDQTQLCLLQEEETFVCSFMHGEQQRGSNVARSLTCDSLTARTYMFVCLLVSYCDSVTRLRLDHSFSFHFSF